MNQEKLPKHFRYTTLKQYAQFKKYCRHYLKLYGLNNYEVHYYYGDIGKQRASCITEQKSMQATLSFADRWDERVKQLDEDEIKQSAHHEVLHLLLSRLTHLIPRYEQTTGKFDQPSFDKAMAAEHELINVLLNTYHA